MNLFVLDYNPILAARYQCTTHKRKMGAEACNMMMWPFKKMGMRLPDNQAGTEVKLSHENHPATKWINASKYNYRWAYDHTRELLREYSRLYKRDHYANTYLNFIKDNFDRINFDGYDLTPFARCFGPFAENLIEVRDTVQAYRQFYWLDKQNFAKWETIGAIPDFWPKDRKYIDKSFKNGDYTKR